MTATPKSTPRASATASAKKTTTAPRTRKPANAAPETKYQKAQRLATEANAALLRETEAEAARHAAEQVAAKNAQRAAEVAARTAEDAATNSAAEKAKLDERLNGRPTATIVPEPEPDPEPAAPAADESEPDPVAVVEEEGEPEPAAPAADEDEPDSPRFNANPRQWRMLQWLLAILGLFIGALVAKMFLGVPFWIANNPATWVEAILGTVWYIALIGVGFFGGGLIGFRLQNRH